MTSAEETAKRSEGEKGVSAPSISLPKGGGAIRGMGEKFAANPVTGTGSMSVPIATSPGRDGFGPQLSLSYDSGAGNGPFGFGWSLSLPSITRKTDKGLPQYFDGEESDVFILSGAEDLVPELKKDATGKYVILDDPRTVDGVAYRVRRFRPRIEGLFARIERWTNIATGEIHWRSITRDNITTLYGKDNHSRIFDPADLNLEHPTRIFSWLICQSYDDKGNAIVYQYAAENDRKVDRSKANERNRERTANRYLKRILYGNRISRLLQPDLATAEWLFELVFDYGEHDLNAPMPKDDEDQNQNGDVMSPWLCRPDSFSSYRAGFEVRTYRLCQRVLMFHHFEGEAGVDNNCLVRSTDLSYAYEQNLGDARTPIYSFLLSVTQSGYKRQTNGYLKRSLPPVEFEYTQPIVQDTVQEVDAKSLENLPIGLDGAAYQWTDLHGEGIPGILTEQAGAWFYKRNLSPINGKPGNGVARIAAKFAPVELVATKPNRALAGGAQFMDLAGDGRPDLVVLDGPLPGLYEHDSAEGWQLFRPFAARLNRAMGDPNLKFVDLDGDGHADVLISEDDAFVWHGSLGEEGFGPARQVAQPFDEEKGPRLVFADGTQSVYLADLSGDGLTDLARIRNGEVCYWPNLGYGHFGAKVTMDSAPWFDNPDQFDQRRVRLADIDGSGTTDILYLHRDGVRLYFNQSGNSWGAAQLLDVFPRVDNLTDIMTADLLGNGTACLVWSSPLPVDARRPMRYVNLMGGQKPHLLVKTINNLGAKTEVHYAPSTKFYLADKYAGKPWITKLPFPVHCVEKVTVTDKWRNTRFASTYSYHHGYFDGIEREFRGFGRVEQVDVEDYDTFAEGNIDSPYITPDRTLYQPPVKTITWYHTGATLDRQRILTQFATEYFPARYPQQGGMPEKALPEPELDADLSAEEWREALRACKGMVLRQEIYELEVDALHGDAPTEVPVRLFSAAAHNCHIRRIQPQGDNRHAVFLVTESEAISYHYELDLRDAPLEPDPRIAHTLNLRHDEYGNAQQSVAIAYGRVAPGKHAGLPRADLIDQVQAELHIAYSETRYTKDVVLPEPIAGQSEPIEHYRLRLPCEVLTYELKGIKKTDAFYYALADFRKLDLSEEYGHEDPATVPPLPVVRKEYHEQADGLVEQKRLVEHGRTLFFAENLVDPLPFGEHGRLGLTYEAYKLALTDALLNAIFQRRDAGGALIEDKLAIEIEPAVTGRSLLASANRSGYVLGSAIESTLAGQYWIRSGTAGFEPDAALHFYLPERYTDPFGNITRLKYDPRDLFIQSSTDMLGNTTGVIDFNYRVLAPSKLKDINDNETEAYFDILGMVVAVAVKGKGDEADNLDGYDDEFANPSLAEILNHFDFPPLTADQARTRFSPILGNATTRFLYHFGEQIENGQTVWASRPAGACAIVREQHVADVDKLRLTDPAATSPLQIAFECSDGMGAVLMKRSQAEPETTGGNLRWIVSGKTVLNNKAKPVKQYEPYFSIKANCCAEGDEHEEVGVTPLMVYDAPGRLVRTELPDGTFSRVEFSPWHVKSFDANDTIIEPNNAWYARHTAAGASVEDKRAARQSLAHQDTPALTVFDSLGREVIAIAHNRVEDANGLLEFDARKWRDEYYLTFTKLDAEGKPLWIRDARGNMVMQYITPAKANNDPSDVMPANAVPCYDIAGNLLFQHSMDAGDRWMLMDAAGKPMVAWDFNERQIGNGFVGENRLYFTEYDELHRPTAQWLRSNGDPPQMVERYEYRDTQDNDASARANNLYGQLVRHYDPSGLVETIRRDFKGNVEEVHRCLNNTPQASLVDWQGSTPTAKLETEAFVQITRYDALNRMTQHYNWHRSTDTRVAVYEPAYNQRGALRSEKLTVRAIKTPDDYSIGADTKQTVAIREIRYDAKGQKEFLELGNGTLTQYDYDPLTFRLRQIRTTRPADPMGFPQRHSNLTDPSIVQQLHYTYDPVGNITEVYDEAYEPVFFKNQQVEPRSRYAYDALYRLIEATGRESRALSAAPPHHEGPAGEADFPIQPTDPKALRIYTQRYRYDAVGNFVEMRHLADGGSWTRTYTPDTHSNRLAATDTDNPLLATTYAYDTHGNMRNLANVAPGQYLRWDQRDMIGSLDLMGGGWAYYQYDAGKQRTRKRLERSSNGGSVEERIYLGGYELYRRYRPNDPTAVEEIESHHLFEGELRVLLVDDVIKTDRTHADGTPLRTTPILRYQYGNHLGSAGLELDEQAGVISYEEYHPYGTSAYRAMKRGIEAPPKRYQYTGMERDEESGLGYHGARYFAPWVGRWVSCDPLGTRDGLHLYAYVLNNPVSFIDSTGNQHQAPSSGANAQTALKFHQLKILYGQQALASGTPLGSFPTDGFQPSQKATGSQEKTAPGSVAHQFVSDLDRQKVLEQKRDDMQWRAAAIGAAVGVTLIAPEVVILLGLEGTTAATAIVAAADIGSATLLDYGVHGDLDATRITQTIAFGALMRGFLGSMPTKASSSAGSKAAITERADSLPVTSDITGISARGPAPAPAAQVDVVLGKELKDLQGFGKQMEVVPHSYHTWHQAKLIKSPISDAKFVEQFTEATSKTGQLRFNLEGVDIERALTMTAAERAQNPILTSALHGQVTEWELARVMNDPDLFSKALFYYGDNVPLGAADLASFGIRYTGH